MTPKQAYLKRVQEGKQYHFTQEDCKLGYERCMELHPLLWYPLSRKRNGKKQTIWSNKRGPNGFTIQ